jgi:hypothetical protein
MPPRRRKTKRLSWNMCFQERSYKPGSSRFVKVMVKQATGMEY